MNACDVNEEARRLVAAYYAYHSDDGECPCSVCEKARAYFVRLLALSAVGSREHTR